jgi:hypothetical protein
LETGGLAGVAGVIAVAEVDRTSPGLTVRVAVPSALAVVVCGGVL